MSQRTPVQLLDDLIHAGQKPLLAKLGHDCSLGDWLKLVKLRLDFTPEDADKLIFWENVESARVEVLPNSPTPEPPTSLSEEPLP